MRRHLPTRLLVCAAMAGTASLGAVAGFTGAAGATTPLTLTCTTLTGGTSGQNLSGCTGTAATTAAAGAPAPVKGVETLIGSTPKGSASGLVTQTKFTNGHLAIATVKETAQTKNIPTTTCAKTHAGVGKQTIAAYVTYTGTVDATAKSGTKTYTTTAKGMAGGAVTGNLCVYATTVASGSVKKGTDYLYNKVGSKAHI